MYLTVILILMRNIAVLSILVIMLFPLFSQEQSRNYGFSAGTHLGFVYGQAFEYVYPTITKGEFLSELRYDMKPVFYLGFQADFSRIDLMSAPGFFASLDFKIGIPGNTGGHQNRDWMDIEKAHLTHFSTHSNRTSSFYWLDAAIGASIPVKSIFYIKPFISGSWMHFAFTGTGGKGTYARKTGCSPECTMNTHINCKSNHYNDFTNYDSIKDNPHKYIFNGNVIRYQQDWLILAAGFSVGTNIISPFTFELTFQISPLTNCTAIDEHLTTKVTYRDYSSWGLFLEPKGRISFAIKNFDLSLETAYRYIGKTKGPSYNDYGNPGTFSQQGQAGAGLSLMDVRFLASYRF